MTMLIGDQEAVVFPPGTLVLQYIDDSHRCFGVVVDPRHKGMLSLHDLQRFDADHSSGMLHIVLILGWFSDYAPRSTMFGHGEEIPQFPHFIVGKKETATPCGLEVEYELAMLHEREPKSRGLRFGRLRQRMFGFTLPQKVALTVLAVLRYYCGGGGEPIPKDALPFAGIVTDAQITYMLHVFSKVFPRD